MSAMTIGSLRVEMGLDAAGFQSGAQAATGSLNKLGERIKGLGAGYDRFLMAQQRAGGSLTQMAAAAQASVAGFAGISEATKRATDSARAFQESLDARGRVDALAASLDPMVAATQRYEAAVLDVRDALNMEAISAERAETVLGQLKARHDATVASMGRMGQSSGMAAANVGNLAAQFQDIGVMLAAGQNPLQLAVQQGSQISQVLGPMGARGAVRALGQAFMSLVNPVTFITIGAIAGGATLLQWLMNTGEEAESVADGMETARDAVRRYRDAAQDAAARSADLASRFGNVTDEVRRLLDTVEAAEREAAMEALTNQADALAQSFGGFSMAAEEAMGSEYERTLGRIRNELELSGSALVEMAAGFMELERAETAGEIADAAQDLHDQLFAAGQSLNDVLLVGLREIITLAREGEAIANRVANIDPRQESISGQRGIRAFGRDRLNEAAGEGILALIRQSEGTAGPNGYNTSLGYGRFLPGGRETDLTNRTLAEILELQRGMLAHPDNTFNSSALGAYQIVSTTLRSLIKDMGLSLGDRFSAELQDQMAGELLRRRQGQGLTGLRNEWQGLERVSDATITRAMAGDTEALAEAEERVADARRGTAESAQEFIERQREAEEKAQAERERIADEAASVAERELGLRQDLITASRRATQDAEFELSLMGKSASETARLRAEYILTNQALANGIDLTERMAGSTQTYGDMIEATAASVGRATANQEALTQAQDAAAASAERAAAAQAQMASSLANFALQPLQNSRLGGLMNLFPGIQEGAAGVFQGFLSGGFGGAAKAIGSALSGLSGGLAGLGTAIGAIAGPVGLAIGLFQGLRTKTTLLDQGMRVTIKGLDLTAETFKKVEKSRFFGLSKKVRTSYGAADAEIADPIEAAYLQLRKSAVDMGGTLGASALRLQNFSYQFNVSLKGMTDEQKARAIEAEFGRVSDAMAEQLLPGLRRFADLGESATQTLERLSTSLLSTNEAFKSLGFRVYQAGLDGAAAASEFVKVFGSVGDMAQATAFYFREFYSDAERTADATRRLTEGVAALGLDAVPRTEAEFRAMVDGLAASGRMLEAGGLIKLAPIFQEIAGAADDLAESLDAADFASRFDFERARGQAANRTTAPGVAPAAGQDAVLEELKALRAENAALRAEQRQLQLSTEQNTHTFARILREWDRLGMPAVRSA